MTAAPRGRALNPCRCRFRKGSSQRGRVRIRGPSADAELAAAAAANDSHSRKGLTLASHVDESQRQVRPRVSQADHQNRSLRRHRHHELSDRRGSEDGKPRHAGSCRVDLRDSYMYETAFNGDLPENDAGVRCP